MKKKLEGLFEEDQKGVNRREDFLDSIATDEKIVSPILRELGFGMTWVRHDKVNEKLQPTDSEKFATWEMRFMLHGCGKLCEIYPIDAPDKKAIVHICTRKSAKPKVLGIYPVYNIPGKWAEEHMHLDKKEYVKLVTEILGATNVYFLLITETNQYWFDRYDNIPLKYLYPTWHGKGKGVWDRLATRAAGREGKLNHVAKGLSEQLTNAIYHK